MKNLLLVLALLVLTASCVDRHGVIGAIFRLSDDSPLPSWVTLPQGMTRDQVSVTIVRYEATTTPQWKIRFVVRDKRRWILNTIQEQIGWGYWHPDSLSEKIPAATHPNWVIVKVNGTEQVYEQSERGDLLRIVKKSLFKTYTGFPGKWQPGSALKTKADEQEGNAQPPASPRTRSPERQGETVTKSGAGFAPGEP